MSEHGETSAGGPLETVGRTAPTLISAEPGIVVRGHGEVEVVPDALQLELAVETGADGVSDALAATRTTMASLRDAVAGAGIARKDLRTSGLNVWQRYNDGGDKQVGYQAGESLSVLVRDPDSVDQVLEAASTAAGDRFRVQGLTFVVTDRGEAQDNARRLAFDEAERVAGVYAAALGRELGGVVRLAEGGGDLAQPMFGRAKMADLAAGVERGTQTISADVTVEWAFG